MRVPHAMLLAAFALAAGCSVEYETFTAEFDRLDCEITAVCQETAAMCEDITGREQPDCIRYRQRLADQCLADMEDWLSRVEENTNQCGVFESAACDDVTEWVSSRRGCNAIEGRPIRHEGEPVLAEVVRGDAWAGVATELERGFGARAAGERWLQIARHEHASIAAFSALALQLLELGGPPDLVVGCHRAALDEVTHSKDALSIARSLLDEPVDPGPLPIPKMGPTTLRQVAIEALVEGCIGEGAAAARAHAAAARACEPIADVLVRVAEDETRHAALAWSTLRWALSREPSLAEDLHRALAESGVGTIEEHELADPARGLLSSREHAKIHAYVVQRLVRPLLRALTRTQPRNESRSTGSTASRSV